VCSCSCAIRENPVFRLAWGEGLGAGERRWIVVPSISGWDQAARGEGREAIAFLEGSLPEKTHGAAGGEIDGRDTHGRQSGLQPDEKGL